MKVFYPGTDVGYHILDKGGKKLNPGEQEVSDAVGQELIRRGICREISARPERRPPRVEVSSAEKTSRRWRKPPVSDEEPKKEDN